MEQPAKGPGGGVWTSSKENLKHAFLAWLLSSVYVFISTCTCTIISIGFYYILFHTFKGFYLFKLIFFLTFLCSALLLHLMYKYINKV